VTWQQPRLVAPGRPNLLLCDIREVTQELNQRRERIFATTAKSLTAAAEVSGTQAKGDVAELARKHGVEAETLGAWLDYLGIGSGGPVKIDSYFTNTTQSASNYDFIKGWNSSELPNLLANSSDQHVRIPGNMKPHSVAVHPSAQQNGSTLSTMVTMTKMTAPARCRTVV
jgi:transposase-like protein